MKATSVDSVVPLLQDKHGSSVGFSPGSTAVWRFDLPPDLPASQRRESGSQGREAPVPKGVDGRERGASIAGVGGYYRMIPKPRSMLLVLCLL